MSFFTRRLYVLAKTLPQVWRSVKKDSSGNVLVFFGVAAFAVMAMVGAGVDYSRQLNAVSKAQGAADAAALAIARSPGTATDNLTVATKMINATLTGVTGVKIAVTQPTATSYRVALSHAMSTAFMQMTGVKTMNVAVAAEAAAGASGPVEVALALDNTGSMRNDMPALRAAAADFARNLFAQGGGQAKMSVVPYVAAVNPGANAWPLWMIDTGGKSMWHAYYLTWQWIAVEPNCTPNWMKGGADGGGGAGPGGSSSGDRTDAIDVLAPMTRFASKLFGVASAHAQTTPNTIPPLQPDAASPSPEGFFIPKGFSYDARTNPGNTDGCAYLNNPGRINHLDLFARIPGAAWKGCVEARPSSNDLTAGGYGSGQPDYDVNDDPPVAGNPHSLFVPYFWPDESDYLYGDAYNPPGAYPPPSGAGYHNNYMSDSDPPTSWSFANPDGSGKVRQDDELHHRTILKYNGVNAPAIIRESGNADTYGPNSSCPDPVLRLTNSATAVDSKINALSFWTGGGTVISEGLMWAWRSLSPNLPFADGKAYDKANRKAIVLMTDGVNGLAENVTDMAAISDYSAYSYLGAGRQGPLTPSWNPTMTFDAMTTFLDGRTRAACANAKAKGIEIYTVFFNRGTMTATQQASSRQLLKDCSTNPQSAFEANSASSLMTAFAQVGAAIGKVRLVK